MISFEINIVTQRSRWILICVTRTYKRGNTRFSLILIRLGFIMHHYYTQWNKSRGWPTFSQSSFRRWRLHIRSRKPVNSVHIVEAAVKPISTGLCRGRRSGLIPGVYTNVPRSNRTWDGIVSGLNTIFVCPTIHSIDKKHVRVVPDFSENVEIHTVIIMCVGESTTRS